MNINNQSNFKEEWNLKSFDSQSSVKRYGFEWKEISQYLLTNNLTDLKKYAIKGNLKTSKFRSICWALFFGLLDKNDSKLWNQERLVQRLKYTQLKQKFFINPQVMLKNSNDDPLSQSDKSIWNQHFCDQELCAVIKQDVVRTFPGIEFFRKTGIQEIITSILFCYAREHPEMCYRQGMHEIVAPILFVIHSDHQSFRHFCEMNERDEICSDLQELLNEAYIEEDTYILFSYIMSQIEHFYRINDVRPTSTGYFPVSPFPSVEHTPEEIVVPDTPCQRNLKSDVEIVGQLNIIRDHILAQADPSLYNHLQKLDIPLSLFGIRWLRLLFGREFVLQDLLILWDAIFAEDDKLNLTSYIVVAMLISIRDLIVNNDYTTCLTYLMKYPNTIDISMIIKLSLHIKSPNTYDNPLHTNKGKVATIPRRIQATTNHIETSTNRIRETNTIEPRPHVSHEQIDRVTEIQKIAARTTAKTAAQSHNAKEHELGIVEGYRVNDPEVSIITLQHAQSIMSISRFKLIQYVATMRKYLPENVDIHVNHSLDGIEEICSLLKNCYSTYAETINIPFPVEPALEANEAASGATSSSSLNKSMKNLSLDLNKPASLTKTHPWRRLDNSTATGPESEYYEIPDNSTMATKLFGNVREIPMRVFKSATAHDPKDNKSNKDNILTPDPTKDRNDEDN